MFTRTITASLLAAGTILGGAGSMTAYADTAAPGTAAPGTAATPPSTASGCAAGTRWPAYIQGAHDVDPGGDGVYIWHCRNDGFSLRVTHPFTGPGHGSMVDFTGTLVTNGTFNQVQRVRDERDDSVTVSADGHVLTYNLHDYGWIDGVDFSVSCKDTAAGGAATAAGTTPAATAVPCVTSTASPQGRTLAFDLKADGFEMKTQEIHLGSKAVSPGSNPFVIRSVSSDTTTAPVATGTAPVSSSPTPA